MSVFKRIMKDPEGRTLAVAATAATVAGMVGGPVAAFLAGGAAAFTSAGAAVVEATMEDRASARKWQADVRRRGL